jgi:hypothetical protein
MTDLLNTAVTAHGGLERWNRIKAVDVALSITGAIWYVKGRPDVLKDISMRVHTDTERVVTDFPGQGKRTTFSPESVTIANADGSVIEEREEPERSFEGQQIDTPWDDVHVAYFSGEALWTYLNAPFLYTRPDFVSEEIDPIVVEGETWRRLKVTFPDTVKSHTREQISCFGPDGLLRRHDYTVDILGGSTGLNYAADYRTVDGIVFPMTRDVYAYQGNYERVDEPLLVHIELKQIQLLR